MSQVPVKWVKASYLITAVRKEQLRAYGYNVSDAVPVVPLSALREVVEGLKRNAENEPEQNGYLSAIVDLQRLLASLGEEA